MNDDVKDQYDFSHGERGKSYRPGAAIRLPVYLDEHAQDYLAAAAERKGRPLSDIVNDLLKREIATAEELK